MSFLTSIQCPPSRIIYYSMWSCFIFNGTTYPFNVCWMMKIMKTNVAIVHLCRPICGLQQLKCGCTFANRWASKAMESKSIVIQKGQYVKASIKGWCRQIAHSWQWCYEELCPKWFWSKWPWWAKVFSWWWIKPQKCCPVIENVLPNSRANVGVVGLMPTLLNTLNPMPNNFGTLIVEFKLGLVKFQT